MSPTLLGQCQASASCGSNPRFCANPERAGAFYRRRFCAITSGNRDLVRSRASTSQSRASSVQSQASPQPGYPRVRTRSERSREASRWEHFLTFLPPARSWILILNAKGPIRCDLSIFRTSHRSSSLKVALTGTLLKWSWGQQFVSTFHWALMVLTLEVQATSAIQFFFFWLVFQN